MSPAVSVHPPTHTVLGIEHSLAEHGVPFARLLEVAGIARSTWSRWSAGGAKRPDKWAAATAAFEALVAEAAPASPDVEPEPPAADVVALTGSSAPTGEPPRFVPVATAAPAAPKVPIAVDPDAALVDLAGRLAALAPRQDAVLFRAVTIESRVDEWDFANRPPRPPARPSRTVMSDQSTATHRVMVFSEPLEGIEADIREAEAYGAACRAHRRRTARRKARSRAPYLLRLADRMGDRVRRWSAALADMQPATTEGLAAKTAAAVAVAAVARDAPWGQALTEAANRDGLRLAAGGAAPPLRLVASAAGEGEAGRDALAVTRQLTAEWLDAAAWETRMRAAIGDLEPAAPAHDAIWDEARRRAATFVALARRMADTPATTSDGLALKAAAVVAACGETGLDYFIADGNAAELSEVELAVALSLVRDMFALAGAPARRLADAALHPAPLPIGIGAAAAEPARTAA